MPFNSAAREPAHGAAPARNGVVYFGFASHGDNQPYHGWVFGYNAVDAAAGLAVCLTPNDESGGVWMGGDGLATDATGSLYFVTGDGTFDGERRHDYGDSYIKMSARRAPSPTTSRRSTRPRSTAANLDLGSGGALLLPDQPGAHPHEMVSAGKDGTIYLVDRDNMGHYNTHDEQHRPDATEHLPAQRPPRSRATSAAPVYFNGYRVLRPATAATSRASS